MQCPVDQAELLMTDRNGVEIDYCPKCRGVWLDRGELDKIIERSASGPAPTRPETRQAATTGSRDVRADGDEYAYDQNGKRKKKRGSFLEDLFDF